MIGDPARRGGYLCISDAKTGQVIGIFLIGEVPLRKKQRKYIRLCQEKNLRLFLNPSHFTSSQSRDADKAKYGGAIHLEDYLIAFSGLYDDQWDEAVVI